MALVLRLLRCTLVELVVAGVAVPGLVGGRKAVVIGSRLHLQSKLQGSGVWLQCKEAAVTVKRNSGVQVTELSPQGQGSRPVNLGQFQPGCKLCTFGHLCTGSLHTACFSMQAEASCKVRCSAAQQPFLPAVDPQLAALPAPARLDAAKHHLKASSPGNYKRPPPQAQMMQQHGRLP